MCISFFYIDSKCSPNTFRLILVFNRDESYARKTENAQFWKDFPTILGGRDLQSEYRGTWLGAGVNGKVGAFLSIEDKPMIPTSESRGVLVADYLKRDIDARQYVQELQDCRKIHYGFNLLLFDLMSSSCPALLYSVTNYGRSKETIELPDGIYGIGNSTWKHPFKKVERGKEEFERVIKDFNHVEKKETLLEELLRILKSDAKHYPDTNMCKGKVYRDQKVELEKLSSVFVCAPEAGLGTRSHTILMVDFNYTGYFHEFSMKDTEQVENPEWIHNQFTVKFSREGQ